MHKLIEQIEALEGCACTRNGTVDSLVSRAAVVALIEAASAPTPSAPTAPAQGEPVAYRYIVIGYGETDYPQSELVATRDKLLDAVLGMIYTNPSDADPEVREAYRKGLDDEDEWCANTWKTEFEIGGIVIYDLGGKVPQPAVAKEGMTDEQRDQMQRAFETSSFYFNGETPTARVESWRVWVEAWKSALASAPTTSAPTAPAQGEPVEGAAPWPECKYRVCFKNGACWDAGKCLDPAQVAAPVDWPSDRDAAIQACALMILGICKTELQENWPKRIEGRIRYMLTRIAPQPAPAVAKEGMTIDTVITCFREALIEPKWNVTASQISEVLTRARALLGSKGE